MSQVESLLPLLGLRMLTGIGEAAVFVGAATLIADLSPRQRRAEGASYFSVAVFTGLGLGPVFGEQLLNDIEFERTFIAGGIFALVAGCVALFAPDHVVSPDEQSGASSATTPKPARSGLSKYVHPSAILPGAVLALGVGGLTSFFLFVPDYSRDLGLSNSGGLFLVYALVSLLIRIFGATLPDRLGPRRMVTIALAAFAVGLLALAAIASMWTLWFAAVLIGIGAAFNYPSLNALTVNRVDDAERAVRRSVRSRCSSRSGRRSAVSAIGGLGATRREAVGVLRRCRDGARRLVRAAPTRWSPSVSPDADRRAVAAAQPIACRRRLNQSIAPSHGGNRTWL